MYKLEQGDSLTSKVVIVVSGGNAMQSCHGRKNGIQTKCGNIFRHEVCNYKDIIVVNDLHSIRRSL